MNSVEKNLIKLLAVIFSVTLFSHVCFKSLFRFQFLYFRSCQIYGAG